MAGLSKEALAAKNTYLATNPDGKEWKDLTDEEKAPWLAGDLPPKADQEPYGPPAVDPDDLKKLPSGQVVDGAALNVAPTPVNPSAVQLVAAPTPSLRPPVDLQPTGEMLILGSAGPQPLTDPEHGDLTPAFARWFRATNGPEVFRAKYEGRFDLLPPDLIS